MIQSDSFAGVLARLDAWDEDAAAEIVRRSTGRLIGLARAWLGARARPLVDPEDVVQSVYRSFFTRRRDGQFRLETWDDLWSLLMVITRRKCANRVEFLRARRRDAAREIATATPTGDLDRLGETADSNPTPDEAAMLAETVSELMRGLDRDDREAVELLLQGYTIPEISERLGHAERTLRRLRNRMEDRLRRLTAADVR
jgi:RNA polymerase sigma-70 factor (ECF subfamily)